MRRFVVFAALLGLVSAVGCGGPALAPVSGVVNVNGKPYKDAVVSFQPIAQKGSDSPGRGSAAVTDENGKFSLIYDGESPGAVVGKHRVRIFTKSGADVPADLKSESIPGIKFVEPIPSEWNEDSTKEFEVPRGGTTAANFEIEAKGKGKGGKK